LVWRYKLKSFIFCHPAQIVLSDTKFLSSDQLSMFRVIRW
jgi:hypothetical protein